MFLLLLSARCYISDAGWDTANDKIYRSVYTAVSANSIRHLVDNHKHIIALSWQQGISKAANQEAEHSIVRWPWQTTSQYVSTPVFVSDPYSSGAITLVYTGAAIERGVDPRIHYRNHKALAICIVLYKICSRVLKLFHIYFHLFFMILFLLALCS